MSFSRAFSVASMWSSTARSRPGSTANVSPSRAHVAGIPVEAGHDPGGHGVELVARLGVGVAHLHQERVDQLGHRVQALLDVDQTVAPVVPTDLERVGGGAVPAGAEQRRDLVVELALLADQRGAGLAEVGHRLHEGLLRVRHRAHVPLVPAWGRPQTWAGPASR